MKFRDLKADEIEVRVGSIKKDGTGLSLLLYKDARCDMNILDETVGPDSWQRKHYECKKNLYCTVGILTPNNGWVWKDDCGSESNTEKEKGEASDSFKRACVNWGIGRELYTAPLIWVTNENCNIKKIVNTLKCYDDFVVQSINIVNKKIVSLEIYNKTLNKLVYPISKKDTALGTPTKQTKPTEPTAICPKCGNVIKKMTTAKGTVWQPQDILERYGMCRDCYKAGQQ